MSTAVLIGSFYRSVSGTDTDKEEEFNDSWISSDHLSFSTWGGTYLTILSGSISSSTDLDLMNASETSASSRNLAVSQTAGTAVCRAYRSNLSRFSAPALGSTTGFEELGQLSIAVLPVTLTSTRQYLYIKCNGNSGNTWTVQLNSGTDPFGTTGGALFGGLLALNCIGSEGTCKSRCNGNSSESQ